MKFELDPPGVRFSDKELLDDLRRVAALTGKSLDRLLDDLRRVSQLLGKQTVSLPEYRRLGRWSERPFVRVFGGWTHALSAAGLELDPQFKERISDETLFENLEDVWTRLGRAPRYSEFHRPLSAISRGTYCGRFGSWRNALESFVAWVNSDREPSGTRTTAATAHDPVESHSEAAAGSESYASPTRRLSRQTPREINLRLRFRVLQRDRFTCRACGRSPATVPGLVLHVDHVVPWSAGGETIVENLQTLCEPCNLGKGSQRCGDAR